MHIAESGRPIVYQAMGGFLDPDSMVTGCHFNHPDRFYVCMLNNKKSILVGRVAVSGGFNIWTGFEQNLAIVSQSVYLFQSDYGPVEVSLKNLIQIHELVETIFAVEKKFSRSHSQHKLTKAQNEVLEYIFERAIFTASFSGKIYMWYFSDPKYFFQKILEHDEQCVQMGDDCPHKKMKRPAGKLSSSLRFKTAPRRCFQNVPLFTQRYPKYGVKSAVQRPATLSHAFYP